VPRRSGSSGQQLYYGLPEFNNLAHNDKADIKLALGVG